MFKFYLALVILLTPVAAAPPAWWSDGDPPVITGSAENNRGPANIGQAKYMVAEALRALQATAPGIATQIRADLVVVIDLSVPDPKDDPWIEQQKAPLLLGQLKAISAPFYTRLNTANATWLTVERVSNGTNHSGSIFPWTATTGDDVNQAIATIGQLKAVFSLRFENFLSAFPPGLDTDLDGIPDAWEIRYGYNPVDPNDTDLDFDNDGISNAQEYALGLNPWVKNPIGPINLGFDDDGTDAASSGAPSLPPGPDYSFRPENPADLYHQDGIPGWKAVASEYIEIWEEDSGNLYAELQSHWDANGLKQEFDMLPGTQLTFLVGYKGRYEICTPYDNEFKLEIEGASQMLANGSPAEVDGTTRRHSFMSDDEWEKYKDWKYAAVSISTAPGTTELTRITLRLIPKNTTTPEGDKITRGGFVDLLPVEVKVVSRDDPLKTWTTGPVTSGPVVYTSPTISEVSNGDLISWGVPGLVNGSFEWWATGPNSSRKDGPTGAGKNEWKLENPLDWIPGKWRIHCRYTPTGGTVSEFDFEQKLGYRSPDITVLGWIDGTQITLPSGVDHPLVPTWAGGTAAPFSVGFYMGNAANRLLFLSQVGVGITYTIPLAPTAARRYVNAHLIKNSSNTSPPALFQTSWPGSSEFKIVDDQALNAFLADKRLYRSFHRFQAKFELDDLGKIQGSPKILEQDSAVGYTPIDIGVGTMQQEAETGVYEGYLNDKGVPIKFNPKNGKTHSAKLPDDFERYTQGRVSTALSHGGSIGKNLNNLEIPWIWSIPEFSAAHAIAGTIAVPEHEIFPVYHIYFNGKRIETLNSSISEAIIEQFIQLGETP